MSRKRYPKRIRYADEWNRSFSDVDTVNDGEPESANSHYRRKSRKRQRRMRKEQRSFVEFDEHYERFSR